MAFTSFCLTGQISVSNLFLPMPLWFLVLIFSIFKLEEPCDIFNVTIHRLFSLAETKLLFKQKVAYEIKQQTLSHLRSIIRIDFPSGVLWPSQGYTPFFSCYSRTYSMTFSYIMSHSLYLAVQTQISTQIKCGYHRHAYWKGLTQGEGIQGESWQCQTSTPTEMRVLPQGEGSAPGVDQAHGAHTLQLSNSCALMGQHR